MSGFKIGDKIISMDAQGLVRHFAFSIHLKLESVFENWEISCWKIILGSDNS